MAASAARAKNCSDCDGPITKHSKTGRCQPCASRHSNRKSGAANSNWKGDGVKNPKSAGRSRARRLYPIAPDQECQTPWCRKLATDRHHIDGNTLNNDPSNIVLVCHGCNCNLVEYWQEARRAA